MGITIFLVYVFGMILLTKKFQKEGTGSKSFFVNNHASSAWMVGFSIVASCIGASATIGTVGLAFQVGTPAFWWLGSGAVGLSILTIFLAKKVRRSQTYTLPEMVVTFLGARASYVISIIIVIAWTSILAAQLTASTMVIQALTNLSYSISFLASAFLIVLHTLLGGQATVIKLDRIQCLIIIFGLLITALWLMGHNPSALLSIKIEAVNDAFPMSRLIYFLLILGGSYVVCPMLFGRLFSAKNEKTAQKGAFGAVAGLVLMSVVIVLIGLLSKGLIPADTASDRVLVTVLENVFPNWLTLLIYLVLLSAVISSADSCLITSSMILSQDVLKRKSVGASRCCILFLMMLSMLVTLTEKSILDFLLMANDVYVCGVVGPVFVALMYGRKHQANIHLAILGIIIGGALGFVSSMSSTVYLSYIGILLSVLLTIASFHFGVRKTI